MHHIDTMCPLQHEIQDRGPKGMGGLDQELCREEEGRVWAGGSSYSGYRFLKVGVFNS